MIEVLVQNIIRDLTPRKVAAAGGVSVAVLLLLWEYLITKRAKRLGALSPQVGSWVPFGRFLYNPMIDSIC